MALYMDADGIAELKTLTPAAPAPSYDWGESASLSTETPDYSSSYSVATPPPAPYNPPVSFGMGDAEGTNTYQPPAPVAAPAYDWGASAPMTTETPDFSGSYAPPAVPAYDDSWGPSSAAYSPPPAVQFGMGDQPGTNTYEMPYSAPSYNWGGSGTTADVYNAVNGPAYNPQDLRNFAPGGGNPGGAESSGLGGQFGRALSAGLKGFGAAIEPWQQGGESAAGTIWQGLSGGLAGQDTPAPDFQSGLTNYQDLRGRLPEPAGVALDTAVNPLSWVGGLPIAAANLAFNEGNAALTEYGGAIPGWSNLSPEVQQGLILAGSVVIAHVGGKVVPKLAPGVKSLRDALAGEFRDVTPGGRASGEFGGGDFTPEQRASGRGMGEPAYGSDEWRAQFKATPALPEGEVFIRPNGQVVRRAGSQFEYQTPDVPGVAGPASEWRVGSPDFIADVNKDFTAGNLTKTIDEQAALQGLHKWDDGQWHSQPERATPITPEPAAAGTTQIPQAETPPLTSAIDTEVPGSVASGQIQTPREIPPETSAIKPEISASQPPPPEIPRGATGRAPNEPTPPRAEVPLGRAGIDQVVADKTATTRTAGPIGRAVGHIPGVKTLAGAVNPSINLEPGIHIANQAESAIKADLGTRFVSTRKPLLDEIKSAFKKEPEYLGPAENKIKGTFLDIAENPHDYALTPEQSAVLAKVAARDVENVNLVRGQFNGDVGLYTPRNPDAIYLPHINANDDLIAQGVRTEASLGAPRIAKERIWDTARERGNYDSVFKPETDAAKLLTAHDNALSGMAGKETFKIASGGLDKAEAMAEKFPRLAARMDELKGRLTSLKGTAGRLDAKTNDAIDAFMASGKEDADLVALQDSLRPQIGKNAVGAEGPNFGKDRAAINREINQVKAQLDELRPMWRNANLQDRGLVQNPVTFRYHTPEASKSISDLKTTSNGKIVDAITGVAETSRAGALSSDASPLTIQGQMNLWRDPISTGVGLAKMVRDGGADLAGVTAREPELVSRFTQARARPFGIVDPEFAAHTSLIARIPKVGGAIGRFEEKMFEPIMRLEYEAWKRTVSLLDKTHPNETQVWRDHEAANALSKTVPGLSTVERGVSGARGRIERSALTSTSFLASPALVIKDAASGLAKIGTHMSLSAASGRELIAIKHLLTIAGTIEAVSLMSAGMNADNRGLSPEAAIKRALIPGNKEFMALQIKGLNVPLGGPFRSAITGLTPRYRNGEWQAPDLARFAMSKIAPLPRANVDLVRNQDYFGNKMRGGNQWQQLLQSLEYEAEAFIPMTASAIPQGIRQGQSKGEIAQNALSQAAGSNTTQNTPYDERDILSRKTYGKPFTELSPVQQNALKAIPDSAAATYQSTNPAAVAATQRHASDAADLVKTQQGIDQKYIAAGSSVPINPDDAKNWRDEYHTNQFAARAIYAKDRRDFPFTGAQTNDPMRKALDEWGSVIDANASGTKVNWDKVDDWAAANPDKAALVDQYMSDPNKPNKDLTPAVTAYKAAAKQIADAGYFAVKDDVWKQIAAQNPSVAKFATYYDFKDDVEAQVKSQATGAPQVVVDKIVANIIDKNPIAKIYSKLSNAAETQWIIANPKVANVAYEWGYLKPTNKERAVIGATGQ